jgi:hypothetical protein
LDFSLAASRQETDHTSSPAQAGLFHLSSPAQAGLFHFSGQSQVHIGY